MVRCSIIGCKSDSGRKMPDLSFHSFPEDIILRKNWILTTGRTYWTPKPYSKICSKHFEKNLLIKKKKLTVLFPNAVPILEIKACVPASSSISLHEEVNIEVDNNLCTLIEPSVAQVPSTSNQKPIKIYSTNPNKPSTDNSDLEFSPRTLRKKWKSSEKLSAQRLKKIKALREKNRRLTKKLAKLENVIAELKTKSFINEEDGDLLRSINLTNRDFWSNMFNPIFDG